MQILILEPYFTGSHKTWSLGYQKFSGHTVEILSLAGNFWKWRMHGGAITLAQSFMKSDYQPDLLLATDMLDLTTFLSLTRQRTHNIPVALYLHENQLTYPWSPDDRDVQNNRDKHYGFINYVSALSADAVFFNSQYNMIGFLDELTKLLKHFPDHNGLQNVEHLAARSSVLRLGLDLKRLNSSAVLPQSDRPVVLWNHRWEFDKNPAGFFAALRQAVSAGLDFNLVVLGERFSQHPGDFGKAREEFGERVLHWGYVTDVAEYAYWLHRADVLPVTSRQDFFGGSVAEAIYCGCRPILPRRLAYPELIPAEFHAAVFYDSFEQLTEMLITAIREPLNSFADRLKEHMQRYDWRVIASEYDRVFAEMV